ncbi:MAG: glycosyltransferase [Acidobacteria bacterium]|nr:glycosyltransferase [Acidobacteriota bacterium]
MNSKRRAKPIRVLHKIYCLGRGGIETWLMNLVRQRSDEVQFDFAVGVMWGGYEEEAQSYGCRFHCEVPPSRLVKRAQAIGLMPKSRFLENVLAENRYDVFHVHGDEFMGDAAKIAARAGVPVRVVHCHNTVLARGTKSAEMVLRKLRFLTLDRGRTLKHATDIVGCSVDAGRFLAGKHWERDGRCMPLYCGIPLDQFRGDEDGQTREAFRRARGIPDGARVIGHAGSMGPSHQKNHFFLLKVFGELARRDPRYFLYLAGDGPQRPAIREAVDAAGLGSRVAMPGLCADVPALMVRVFDVLLLPSLQEGLPVVGLEAVAAGLPTVCSDTISGDFTEYFAERVATVPLDEPPAVWADRVEAAFARRIAPSEGLALLRRSRFSIESSLAALTELYRRRLETVGQGTA